MIEGDRYMCKKIKSIISVVMGVLFLALPNGIVGECHTLPETSYTAVEGTIIKRGAGISDFAAANDIAAYQKLPAAIQNALIENNVSVYEINPDYDAIPVPKACAVSMGATYKVVTRGGQTTSQVLSSGYIDILSNKAAMQKDPQNTFLHEIGHQIDFLYLGGYPVTRTYYNASGQQEWQTIYAAEKDSIASFSKNSSYNVYTAYEAFAEATGQYFLAPDWLQSNCPLSYAYITKVVASF